MTIPSGHPLYNLLANPQYQDVIRQYLGDAAATSNMYCTLHDQYTQQAPSGQDSQSFAEAKQVLALADNMLGTLDPNSQKYQAIRNAADYLRLLIGSDYPNQAEIMNAMETLTRAMGGVY